MLRLLLTIILLMSSFYPITLPQRAPDQPGDTFLPIILRARFPVIENGDFELGNNGDWLEESAAGYWLIVQDDPVGLLPVEPRSGSWLAWLGGIEDEVANLSQSVVMPAYGPAHLRYFYQIDSEKPNCGADVMRLMVNDDELTTMNLCQAVNTSDWMTATVDLSLYTGQTITLTFNVTTNAATSYSSFFLDDVSLIMEP